MGTAASCRETRVLSLSPHGPHGAEHGCYCLELANPGLAPAVAGQFVMLRPAAYGQNPIWARPFSVCRLTPEVLTLFFQVCGRGTTVLAQLAPGDPVTIWGPLGRGFAVEPQTPTLLLAGGLGLAPFVEYAASHPAPDKLSLLFGHRAPLDCYPYATMARDIAAEAFQEREPADRERFCALLEARIAARPDGLVLACGPRPFLVTVAKIARRHGVRAQVSLENRMACGVGGCLGCVEKNALGRYVQTCTQGPVFWVTELLLSEEA